MKLSINPHYAAPALALALSLPLLNVKNVAAVFAGGIGTAGSIGYLASSLLTSDERKKVQQAITRTKKQLDTREHELSTRFKNATAELQQQLQQAIADRDKAVADSKARLAEIASQRQQLLNEAKMVMGDELRRQFEAEYQAKFEQKTADFDRREGEFYHAEGELCDQIEALQTVVEQNEEYLRLEFDKETSAQVEQFKGRYQKLQGQIAQYGEVIQTASSEAMEELKQKDLLIAKLKGQVELLNAPKKYRGNSHDDKTANKVLEFFLDRGIGVEAEDWQRHYHQLKVLLFPKGGKLAELALLADDLQLALGLYARPTVTIEGSCFSIVCDTDAKVAAKVEIIEPPLSKLEAVIEAANHIRIAAPTGSGKSVLLDNLLWLSQLIWPGAKLDLLDPKYPFTEWSGLMPTFKGADCIDGIQLIAAECDRRLSEATQIVDNGGEIPDYSPHIIAIDEQEQLYQDARNLDATEPGKTVYAQTVKGSLLKGLKVGRALKIKTFYIMQSILCVKAGMNQDDFDNSLNIYLGNNITRALDGEMDGPFTNAQLSVLKAEYAKRKELGQDYLMLISDPNTAKAFIMRSPQPSFYRDQFNRASTKKTDSGKTAVLAPSTEHVLSAENAETQASQLAPGSVLNGASGGAALSAQASTELAPESAPLSVLLERGTNCPDCGHHSNVYKRKKPTTKGEVTVTCKTPRCESGGSFKWKVI
jgi:uncharacterized membrane-anchored protein YhcB (DUF1043 family)